MYATAVGLIIRGFDHLMTYKKSFQAGSKDDYVRTKKPVTEKIESPVAEEPEPEPAAVTVEKVPITDKIRQMIYKMFEVEDQSIN
jgi:hypothetical protein